MIIFARISCNMCLSVFKRICKFLILGKRISHLICVCEQLVCFTSFIDFPVDLRNITSVSFNLNYIEQINPS